jgi:hypothetical protein
LQPLYVNEITWPDWHKIYRYDSACRMQVFRHHDLLIEGGYNNGTQRLT